MVDSSRRDVYAASEILGCSPYVLTTSYSRRLMQQGNHEHSVGDKNAEDSQTTSSRLYLPNLLGLPSAGSYRAHRSPLAQYRVLDDSATDFSAAGLGLGE